MVTMGPGSETQTRPLFGRALFGSRAVIEVRDVDDQAKFFREVGQDEEEGSRIGPPGYCDDHRPRREDLVRADVVADRRADPDGDQLVAGVGIGPTNLPVMSRLLYH